MRNLCCGDRSMRAYFWLGIINLSWALDTGLEQLHATSNPELSWPPQGQDFSGSVETWPGYGEQLGASWPRVQVPILNVVPEQEEFYLDFVIPRQPVVIKPLFGQMTNVNKFGGLDLSAESLAQMGRAAISGVNASYASEPQKVQMSLRELLLIAQENPDVYTYGPISYTVKEKIKFPVPLRCRHLADNALVDTMHIFMKFPFAKPMRQEHHHQFYCMVEGAKEFLLVNEEDFPSWKDLPLREDGTLGRLAPFMNTKVVDYKKQNQALKDIKRFHIARIQSGDCLYVPAGWIHQQNIFELDHSLEIRWEKMEQQSDLNCSGYLSPALTLGDVAWSGENIPKPPERTTDTRRRYYKNLLHMLERTILMPGSRDYKDFESVVKMDPILTPELPEWNEECASIAQELFRILDRNGDEHLDVKDLEGILETDLDHMGGQISDKMMDFDEIIFDMKQDRAGPLPTLPETRVRAQILMAGREEKHLANEAAKLEQVMELFRDEL